MGCDLPERPAFFYRARGGNRRQSACSHPVRSWDAARDGSELIAENSILPGPGYPQEGGMAEHPQDLYRIFPASFPRSAAGERVQANVARTAQGGDCSRSGSSTGTPVVV